jgi:hypothetical protein
MENLAARKGGFSNPFFFPGTLDEWTKMCACSLFFDGLRMVLLCSVAGCGSLGGGKRLLSNLTRTGRER